MGAILDVVIAYSVKLTLRFFRTWGSGKWKRVEARVDSSWVGGGSFLNCPAAEVAYTYEFNGQTYSGIDSKPFLSSTFAEDQVERFQPGESVIVRVNPFQPQRTVLKLADQSCTAAENNSRSSNSRVTTS